MVDSLQPPAAPEHPSWRRHHGDEVCDEFAWMKDQESADFLAYLGAENAYTEAKTAHLADLRAEIFADIKARTQETDLSVPELVRHSDGRAWWYYSRSVEGLDYEIHCRLLAGDTDVIPDVASSPAGEEVLLDENRLAEGHDFFALGHADVSPDGTRLAYATDVSGDEHYDLRVIDLATGAPLAEIPDVAAGGGWAGDGRLVYLRLDEAWRPHEVWLHTLAAGEPDRLILAEPDERFWLGVEESRDRRVVVIAAESKHSSEVRLFDAADPDAITRVVCARRPGLEYAVEVGGDALFIVHNRDAEDFELATAPLEATSDEQWRPVIPGEAGVRILGVSAYRRWLVVAVRRDGLPGVDVLPLTTDGGPADRWSVTFDEPLYSVHAADSDDSDTDRIRLVYQSMVTPPQVLQLRLDDRSREVLKATPVLDHPLRGPYRATDYVQRREWARADDGTLIPISVMHRAHTPLDGSAPALLYGYGAYEMSSNDRFSIVRLSLLDWGFVYAVAHVRGGGEYGRSWYEQGRLANKPTTFSDFVSCARRLVEAGYTGPERLVAEGGSAGGLLIGAALNLAPDAFRAAHAIVPFVDALTTMLDPSLPLTVVEREEWGDPLNDPAAYALMKGYSPYENIRAGARYPALLVTSGLHDTRVEVTEPAKWVARLRRLVAADPARPILLRVQEAAGHGGPSGRYQAWHDAAFEVAWMIDQVTT